MYMYILYIRKFRTSMDRTPIRGALSSLLCIHTIIVKLMIIKLCKETLLKAIHDFLSLIYDW